MSRALAARVSNVIFLSYCPSFQVTQSALLCVSLVTTNRPQVYFCSILLVFCTHQSAKNSEIGNFVITRVVCYLGARKLPAKEHGPISISLKKVKRYLFQPADLDEDS